MKNKCLRYGALLFLLKINLIQTDVSDINHLLTQLNVELMTLEQSAQKLSAKKTSKVHKPAQQQIMPASEVIKLLGQGAKDFSSALNIFKQETTKHQAENLKIPPKTPDILRIMSYNVHFWANPAIKRKGQLIANDFNAIWNVIDTIKPDVLILQEFSAPNVLGKGFLNTFEAQTLIKKGYRYQAACNTWTNEFFGNVVASKLETINLKRVTFKNQSSSGDRRCYSGLTIKLRNGKNLEIFGTHLEVGSLQTYNNDAQIRAQQIQELGEQIKNTPQNCIIAADFNDTRSSAPVRYLLDNNFKDCFTALGWQHPQFTSLFGTEIDFIFLNPQWNLPIAGAYVYYSDASDHLPIILDIKLN